MMSSAEAVRRDAMSVELESRIKQGSPERCITLFDGSPSMAMFYYLRTKLDTATETWLQEFLELDGLESMLDSLFHMTGRGFNTFSYTILSLDCVSCIRAILNTHTGLDFMVNHEDYSHRLSHVLTMDSTILKKQVYEMLSGICAYSYIGYSQILNTMEYLKKAADQTYRFSVVVNELKSADTAQQKTAVLTFVNCIINCTPDLVERNRIRNELIGLQILDILSFFRKEEIDDDLHLQLENFHSKKHEDDDAMLSQSDVDYNSPEDLVDMIQSKMFGTPKMASFINILQDLYSIDTMYSKNGPKLWKTIEKFVHQIVHSSEADVMNWHENPMSELDSISCHVSKGLQYIHDYQSYGSSPWQHSLSNTKIGLTNQNTSNKSENDTGVELTPKMRSKCKMNREMDKIAYMDQSTYDNLSFGDGNESCNIPTPTNRSALQRRYTITKSTVPCPEKSVKDLPLVKLADALISKHGRDSMWATSGQKSSLPDFKQLESMFQHNGKEDVENEEVIFFNPSTRRNINLFLSRIEIYPEELIDRIDRGTQEVDLPTLQYLMKVLPEKEEITLLQNYKGWRLALGTPEQFVLLLADIPDYMVHLQAYLTKAEATVSLKKLQTSLDNITKHCKVILNNPGLKQFLHFILNAGNFLNHGGLRGEASGFRFSSLLRLMEVKSNIPNYSLLHHLVKTAQDVNESMLKFVPEFISQEKAESMSMQELKTEIFKFNKQFCTFIHHLSLSNVRTRDKFARLVEEIKQDLMSVQNSVDNLQSLTQKVAIYMCEDVVTFDLEMTLSTLQQLCKQIRRCQNENSSFQKQADLAKNKTEQLKSTLKSRLMTLEFGKDAGASSSVLEEKSKHKVLDNILDELHRGNFKPVIKSELPTPDRDIETWEISHISLIGSPFSFRPSSEVLEEDFLSPPTENPRTSSAADILSEEPTISHLIGKNLSPAPHVVENVAEKHSEIFRNSDQISRRKSHNRSRSDFTDSILGMEKWVKYEQIKQQESILTVEDVAPVAEPESLCDITTLNLEKGGKLMNREDMKIYQEQQMYDSTENVCLVQDGPVLKLSLEKHQLPEFRSLSTKTKNRGDKKHSLSNLFTRISRAVLRPKGVSESGVDPGKGKKGKKSHHLFRRVSGRSTGSRTRGPIT